MVNSDLNLLIWGQMDLENIIKMFKLNQSIYLENTSSIEGQDTFELVWINPGSFFLGASINTRNSVSSIEEDDKLLPIGMAMDAEITRGFWIGKYLVTQKHWREFGEMEIKSREVWKGKRDFKDDYELPVYGVTWLEAMRFCKMLNTKYKGQIPKGYHFSLPTEIQWEYSCKDDAQITDEEFKYMNGLDNVMKVGRKAPNSQGLYDMLGNVREWCFDIAAYYPGKNKKASDWVGNADEDNWFDDDPRYRVVRGMDQAIRREYASALVGLSNINPPIGFRVSLRPITKWDLNDRLLNKHNINMIG